MPLSPDDRATFLELLSELGDDVDPRRVHAFASTHRHALLDELVAVPGVARIRAGVLRLLPHLVPEAAGRAPLLAQAAEALMQPPTDHPLDRVSRHPAWIGLGVLELAALQGWDADPIERAVQLAARAFEAAGAADIGEGEVLWAMAEEAAEVGWGSRARLLLQRLPDADFASSERRAEALLVLALSRLQSGGAATELLQALTDDADASARVRTHAAWILGQLARQSGDDEAARGWLRKAAERVDREADPEVAARIDEALG